jgi:hypothetical protein
MNFDSECHCLIQKKVTMKQNEIAVEGSDDSSCVKELFCSLTHTVLIPSSLLGLAITTLATSSHSLSLFLSFIEIREEQRAEDNESSNL